MNWGAYQYYSYHGPSTPNDLTLYPMEHPLRKFQYNSRQIHLDPRNFSLPEYFWKTGQRAKIP